VFSQYLQMASDEIAEVLGLDASEAELRVQRAMLELRELFRDLSNGEQHAVR
jgi:DNA-directed RNA polymerase specialized sigma24 family protein